MRWVCLTGKGAITKVPEEAGDGAAVESGGILKRAVVDLNGIEGHAAAWATTATLHRDSITVRAETGVRCFNVQADAVGARLAVCVGGVCGIGKITISKAPLVGNDIAGCGRIVRERSRVSVLRKTEVGVAENVLAKGRGVNYQE